MRVTKAPSIEETGSRQEWTGISPDNVRKDTTKMTGIKLGLRPPRSRP